MKKIVFISILYLVFGIIWIYIGDSLIFRIFDKPEDLQRISLYKGYSFVILTALFIFSITIYLSNCIIKQKNKLETLFLNSGIGYIEVSETEIILDINENIAQRLGYTRKELIRRKTGDITHIDDFKEDTYQWELLKQNHASTYTREKRYLHKNGNPIWFRLKGKMVNDFINRPYFLCSIIDISEQKEFDKLISQELKEKEALINNTSDVVWSVDKNIQLNSFNNAYTQLIKKYYTKRPRTGDYILDKYTDENEKQFWLKGYLRALNNEEFSMTNQRILNGKTYFLKTSLNPIISNHKVVGIACSSKDITEEQNFIETLKESILAAEMSQEVFMEIFENIPVMASLYDHNNKKLKLNKELLQTFGLIRDKNYTLDVLDHIIESKSVIVELKENLHKDFQIWKDFHVKTGEGKVIKQKWINILLKQNRSLSIGIDIKRLKKNTNNDFIFKPEDPRSKS